VDFSPGYDINSHFNVYLTFSTHGRLKEQILDLVDCGGRITLGVHATL
jgi:hypothetical protein